MARRFGRRKRPKVAWFPTFGGEENVQHDAEPWAGVEAEVNFDTSVPGDGVIYNAFPLTFDASKAALDAAQSTNVPTIRDIVQGNEWRLRRIVGKAFISTWHSTLGSSYTSLLDVALGFIVCECHDDGTPTTDFNQVNPLAQDSMEDPWIWRRRWMLNPFAPVVQNLATSSQNNPGLWGYPQTTSDYGSVADGPHIDAKTARVIHRSERLFAIVAARRFSNWGADDPPSPGFADTGLRLFLDYRLLGSLRGTTYGNRGNAAR